MKMNSLQKHFFVISSLLASLTGQAYGQEVIGFSASSRQVSVGDPMTFTLRLAPSPGGINNCAVLVDFGNGESQYVRINSSAPESELRFPINYKYPNPGNYTASAKGKLMVRGLNTLVGCTGEKTEPVAVVDPQVIKMKMELERTQRELKDREEREALRREQELRQREEEVKRREEEALRVRIEAERIRAQNEARKSAPAPAPAPKPAPSNVTPNATGF
jgi:hypothetical protein